MVIQQLILASRLETHGHDVISTFDTEWFDEAFNRRSVPPATEGLRDVVDIVLVNEKTLVLLHMDPLSDDPTDTALSSRVVSGFGFFQSFKD